MQWRLALFAVLLAAVLSVTLAWVWHAAPSDTPAAVPSAVARAAGQPQWSTTWATAPSAAEPGGRAGVTIRDVVHTSIAGTWLRVRLSNRFGTAPVLFAHVTVAHSAHLGGRRDGSVDPSDGSADPATMRDVLFRGAPGIVVAPGADVVSDPVPLGVPADADLLVSMWTPEPSGAVTFHGVARQDSFASDGPADQAAAPTAAAFNRRTSFWRYLSAVEVTGGPGTIVTLGDSITDGAAASPGRNRRWPDRLGARLAASKWPHYGIANAGISGNRVLPVAHTGVSGPSAGERLDEDVLDRSGVRTVIIAEGINDVLRTPHQDDPAKIIAGLRRLAERSRAQGVRVVVATLTPWQGWRTWTPQLDAVRLAVNAWIRAGGDGAFDGVADFDRVLRDPADDRRLKPVYDCGDHLHPNDAGLLALAYAVPLDRL